MLLHFLLKIWLGREGPVSQVPTALMRCVGSVAKRLRSRTSTSAQLCDDMNMYASCFDRIGTDVEHFRPKVLVLFS